MTNPFDLRRPVNPDSISLSSSDNNVFNVGEEVAQIALLVGDIGRGGKR